MSVAEHTKTVDSLPHVLVVDDDAEIAALVVRYLTTQGFLVSTAGNGQELRDVLRARHIDLILLDLGLPGEDGLELTRYLHGQWHGPVIIVSGRGESVDRIVGLELGADDYVTKPFSPRELLARVRAAVRRTNRAEPGELVVFGEVSVDFAKMELTRGGQPVAMTAQEFKLLKFFTQNPARVISRSELLNEVWGYEEYPSTRTVDNHVWKLRLKLETDPRQPSHFQTVHGAGYKFVP